MALLSIADLYTTCEDSLSLTWLVGLQGGQRTINLEHDQPISYVGYLSLIHPHQIQIISSYELKYLQDLWPRIYQDVIRQLFESEYLACLIVVDNIQLPDDFIEAGKAHNVPIWATPLSGETLINDLHALFARQLAQRVTLHGVFMDVFGMGVLIMAESGMGKSELALDLLSRGHRLIADDAPEFAKIAPDTINGYSLFGMNPFLEVRGLGILNVQALFGNSAVKPEKYLRLIVQLEAMTQDRLQSIDRLQGEYRIRVVLGVDIPEISLLVAPGRNLAVLMEAAVRNHSLRLQGYNAADDFCEIQRRVMDTGWF